MIIPTYVCSYLPTYAHTYLRMLKPTHICAYLPTYAHTYLSMCVPTYQCAYLPTYTHTYLQTLGKLCSISDLLFFLIVSHFLSLSLSLSNSKAEYHSSLINISYHSQTSASLSLSLSFYLSHTLRARANWSKICSSFAAAIWLRGFACAYHPAASGLNPNHTIYVLFQFVTELWCERTKISEKEAGICKYF